jgi:hypothetical protein
VRWLRSTTPLLPIGINTPSFMGLPLPQCRTTPAISPRLVFGGRQCNADANTKVARRHREIRFNYTDPAYSPCNCPIRRQRCSDRDAIPWILRLVGQGTPSSSRGRHTEHRRGS